MFADVNAKAVCLLYGSSVTNEITQHKGAITPDNTFKSAAAPKPPWQKRAGQNSAVESCFDLEL